MKLLYISNSRIPTTKAYGHQIFKMCQIFAKRQVAVELICPSRKNPEFKNIDAFAYYHIPKIFKLKKIYSYDPQWLIKFPAGTYIKFQALFFIVSLFIYLLFKKIKLARRGGWAAYIFYTRDEYLLPLLQLFSKRVVWEGHSLPRRKKHYTKYFKQCYRLIVLTHELKKMLIGLGVSENKILVSPDAVELEIFGIHLDKNQARKQLNLPQDKILLGYTGTFKTKNMDKGLKDILPALKIINKNDILFIAIGGSLEHIQEYQELAEKLNIKNIKLIPKVSQQQLAIYQQAFDIMLMPFPRTEHYAYFMSPLKMFENMASGRPIVATDLPAIKEVLNDDNAVLVKPDNPDDLAKGMIKLIKNKELGLQLANQALKDIQQYTWHERAGKIIKFIYETF
ncbi:hypothetical protein A3B87_03320 [Candidatus Kuenenbacteria bacterium RIFCSPHIGHO2_02_FULL_39_13]|uniref:Glycosyl transferase family 1 domain-containing protein n=1 Tax=Candidatus Kuenenbacteria bacterium RIFCSPHIGHO2_02_FULL_39_13 TaxID=1798561 RepID=A0A1F6FM92_9BACT|nr:MAG: hypothetical protein A3B87_03320 [Candidatus Kuenenbacteria bacterium RIFCSPHIGHO2_02_FULL_39_13]